MRTSESGAVGHPQREPVGPGPGLGNEARPTAWRVSGQGIPTEVADAVSTTTPPVRMSIQQRVFTVAPVAALQLDPLQLHAGPAVHRVRATLNSSEIANIETRSRFGYVAGAGFAITTGRGLAFEARWQYRGVPGRTTVPAFVSHVGEAEYTFPGFSDEASHWYLGLGVGMRW